MTAILSEFTLSDLKSYRAGRLPLGPLTVLIGANASGKSNAIEGLRFLSWLAQGQKLSSIQYETNSGDRIIRGRVDDLCHRGETSFSIGCHLNATEWNSLSITLTVRDGELHISHESISELSDETPAKSPLYELDQPSQDFGTDVGVAYNNFARGRNKPRITCSDQMAIFVQLDSPAGFGTKHTRSQTEIPAVVQEYQRVLGDILFLDPVPAKMREYSFKTDRHLQGDGTNLSSVLYRLWHDSSNQSTNQQAILDFIQSLPEQEIARIDFLLGPRDEVMVTLTETFGQSYRDYFCYRDPHTGDSRLIRLGDLDNFPGLVSQGPLGHLVTAGVVDRFIKSPQTPAERKQKALEWLNQLQVQAQ